MRFIVLENFLIAFLVLSTFSGCSNLSDEEIIQNVAQNIYENIKCPNANEWFGSLKICANSYSVNDLIEFSLVSADGNNANMPLNKIELEGGLDSFLQDVVCRGAAGSLGLSHKAIFNKKVFGITQRAIESEFKFMSEDEVDELNKKLATRVRFVLKLSSQHASYKLTRNSYNEAEKIPEKCLVVVTKLNES